MGVQPLELVGEKIGVYRPYTICSNLGAQDSIPTNIASVKKLSSPSRKNWKPEFGILTNALSRTPIFATENNNSDQKSENVFLSFQRIFFHWTILTRKYNGGADSANLQYWVIFHKIRFSENLEPFIFVYSKCLLQNLKGQFNSRWLFATSTN